MVVNRATSVHCGCTWQISAKGTGDGGASARCWGSRSYRTTKVVSSGVTANFSDLFINNGLFRNVTLEAPDRTIFLTFCSLMIMSRLRRVSWSGYGILCLLRRVVTKEAASGAKTSSLCLVIPAREACWHLYKDGFANAGECVFYIFRDERTLRPLTIFVQASLHHVVLSIGNRALRLAISKVKVSDDAGKGWVLVWPIAKTGTPEVFLEDVNGFEVDLLLMTALPNLWDDHSIPR